MTGIGKRIKEIRIKRGLSQENLAESAKINLRTIQRIENNETTPRGNTLKLIFDVLDIEIIERETTKINQKKTKIDNYLIWSLFLTLLIIICSFIEWIRVFKMFRKGERVYTTLNGWNGSVRLFSDDFQNWLLSISTITIGLIVLSNSLGLIKNKLKYIILQLVCVFLYLIALISGVRGEIRPALFIVFVATILLVIAYRKKKRKTVANNA